MSTSYLFSHDGLYDSLTHLYAPSFIYDFLERRLKVSARHNSSMSLIKVVAKRALTESEVVNTAHLLSSQVRPDDIIGRMGHFEFLIVLSPEIAAESPEHSAAKIAERFMTQSEIETQFSLVTSRPQERLRDLLNRLDAAQPFAP